MDLPPEYVLVVEVYRRIGQVLAEYQGLLGMTSGAGTGVRARTRMDVQRSLAHNVDRS